MELKAAFSKMKSARNAPLFFFYCAQGEDGKPVLLVDAKAVQKSDQDEILRKAKKKDKCNGKMHINDDGELTVIPKGSAPGGLAKGVQIAVRNDNAMNFNGIVIGAAEPEGATNGEVETSESQSTESNGSPPPPAPPPPPPIEGLADQMKFRTKLQTLSPAYIRAIKGRPAKKIELDKLSKKATDAAKAGNYTEALQHLDVWEQAILATLRQATGAPEPPPAPPPPPETGGLKAAVTARFRGMASGIQAVIAGNGPNKTQVQTLGAAITGLIRSNDFEQANRVLDELEPLLASRPPAPPPGGEIPEAPPAPPPISRTEEVEQEEEEDEDSPDIDEAKFREKWPEAKAAWQDASDEVDAQINKLAAKLRASDDPELKQIAEFGLGAITKHFKVPLMAAIRELNSATGSKLKQMCAKAAGIVAGFKKHIGSAETVEACDDNPFSVKMTIKKSIGGALTKLTAFFNEVKRG